MKRVGWFVSVWALACGVAQAEEQPIVVTGQPLAASAGAAAYDLTVIDREALAASASGRIEDVLSGVAGFQQFRRSDSRASNPSSQGVTLRALGGNAASRTLVLLDGVPMADPMFGAVPLSAIAPERLGSVRVTRGGGAEAFGAGAVAGTIAMDSAGADALDRIAAEALANDRGETALSASLAPRLGAGFVQVSGRWDRGAGFWTTPEAQRVPASVKAAYDSWSVSARGVAPVAPDMELQVRGLAYDDHRTLRFAGGESHASGEDASVRLVGRGRWQFDALAYVQDRGFSNVTISASTFRPTLDQRRTPATGLGGKIEIRPPVGGGHVLRLGTDMRRARGDLYETKYTGCTGATVCFNRAGGRNDDWGLFAEDDWSIGPVTLTGGVRADRWAVAGGYIANAILTESAPVSAATPDRSGWAVTGRGGAVWHVVRGLDLRASAYSGLRQPTINELYRSFTLTASGVSTVTNANPALGNEMLKGYEAGLDWHVVKGLRLSATAFDNRVDHAIANVTLSQTATLITRQRQNVDAIHARGLELGAQADVGRFSLDASLVLTDATMATSGAQAALDGLRPAQTPRIAASATLGWKPRAGWQLAATLRHTGAQYEDDRNSANSIQPEATTLGAFVMAPLGHGVSLILRGENLTDALVYTRNQAGSIDYGTPRTLWAGLRFGAK